MKKASVTKIDFRKNLNIPVYCYTLFLLVVRTLNVRPLNVRPLIVIPLDVRNLVVTLQLVKPDNGRPQNVVAPLNVRLPDVGPLVVRPLINVRPINMSKNR